MATTLNGRSVGPSGTVCEARSVGIQPQRERVLVTGASSGIGEAFVRWHAARGSDVVLAARDAAQLQRVAADARALGASAEVIVADLSTAAGVDELVRRCGEIDVLVANAGITHASSVGETDRDRLDALSYLMSTGVVRLCESLVPAMIERGHGDVVIVSSIAAFTPMRKAGPYAGAKSHVTAYARSLALEVGPRGVRVVAVCPGYVHTDLHRRAGLEHLSRRVPGWMWLSPDDVVHATSGALSRGKAVVVPGAVYRLVLPFLSSRPAQTVWRRLTRRR